MMTDSARRSGWNCQSTVVCATALPAALVVKSSQISFPGFAYAGSVDGCTGSSTYW